MHADLWCFKLKLKQYCISPLSDSQKNKREICCCLFFTAPSHAFADFTILCEECIVCFKASWTSSFESFHGQENSFLDTCIPNYKHQFSYSTSLLVKSFKHWTKHSMQIHMFYLISLKLTLRWSLKAVFESIILQECPSLLEEQNLYCTGFSLLTSRCELQNKIEYKVERAKLKN